jgi:apolipoprotein N-acyltransferase
VQPAPLDASSTRFRLGQILLACGMFLWVGAFMPEPQVLCTVPGLVCYLLLIERCKKLRHAVLWSGFFGAIAIGTGYRWLAQTVQDFGNIAPLPSYLMTALFGVMGMAHGVVILFLYRGMLVRGRRPHPLVLVLLFVAAEALPIRLFPWKIGHGAIDVPPLVQAASWGGVSAVSFVLLCLVVPIHEWVVWAFARRGPPARPQAALVTFAVGCAFFGIGHLQYRAALSDEAAATKTLRIGIVQPNVGRKDKRAATEAEGSQRDQSVAAYERGSRLAAKEGAELIVWPETAVVDSVPVMEPKHDPHVTNGYLSRVGYRFLDELGRDHAFLLGMYERRMGRKRLSGGAFDERYNVAALREPGDRAASWSVYRKVFLIPFGEYLPLPLDERKYLPQKFKMIAGETEGEKRQFSGALAYKGLRIVPFLCYEGILPDHVREVCGDAHPDILVSLTNDSWFGDSWEPYQHLNFTRFRAVEHRAPLVRATNTGVSAFVSITGDVAASDRLGLWQEGVLVKDVPILDRGPTIYARFGHWFPTLAAIIVLLALFSAWMRPPPLLSEPRD